MLKYVLYGCVFAIAFSLLLYSGSSRSDDLRVEVKNDSDTSAEISLAGKQVCLIPSRTTSKIDLDPTSEVTLQLGSQSASFPVCPTFSLPGVNRVEGELVIKAGADYVSRNCRVTVVNRGSASETLGNAPSASIFSINGKSVTGKVVKLDKFLLVQDFSANSTLRVHDLFSGQQIDVAPHGSTTLYFGYVVFLDGKSHPWPESP